MLLPFGFRAIVAGIIFFAASTLVSADERILLFAADLDVQSDGRLLVTEHITVEAAGDQIKRGIFRDIPLRARDANGWEYDVEFKLIDVEQDGARAAYFTERNAAGVRIYIGRSDVFLTPGEYEYTIRYEMDRQVRFFDGYDEIYWNVTGNEWAFPIDKASARIRLPQDGQVQQLVAYTGVFGSDGSEYDASLVPAEGFAASVETTGAMGVGEGLTVAAGFAKGLVAEPSAAEKRRMWIDDQRVVVIGSVSLLILGVYYLVTWLMVGRDRRNGAIFPRFEPPEGVSPALALYIKNRGLGSRLWLAVSAACLNLAVRKRVIMSRENGLLSIALAEGEGIDADRNVGERAIIDFLSERGRALVLSEHNGNSIEKLGRNFSTALRKEHRNVFFRTNGWYLVPGFLGSAVAIVCLIAFGNLSPGKVEQAILFGFFSVFATAIAVGMSFGVVATLNADEWSGGPRRAFWVVFVPIFGVWIYGTALLTGAILGLPPTIPLLPVFILAVVLLFFLFAAVISAPTAPGRDVLDAIEGLYLYLDVAERDRMNMTGQPDMSVDRFERLLPYAVALGVEKPWAEQFTSWLKASTMSSDYRYEPGWYDGDDFDQRHLTSSISNAAGQFAGSFKTSLPSSNASSSGSSGGGSSGGGGGGGGGGGW